MRSRWLKMAALLICAFAGSSVAANSLADGLQDPHPSLNGTPLDQLRVGIGDRALWPFARTGDGGEPVWISTYDLVLGRLDEGTLRAIDDGPGDPILADFEALRTVHGLNYVRFLSHWVSPAWQVGWLQPANIQRAIDGGITPVMLFWFFGDKLFDEDVQDFVNEQLDAYADLSRRLGRFLGQFDGDILVVMEPEMNKPAIEKWPEFGDLVRRHGIAEVRAGAEEINRVTGRRTRLFFGAVLTDNGLRASTHADAVYGSKSRGDSYGWTLSRDLLEHLRPDLDFVGFQQMLAQFHRDPNNPSQSVSWMPEDIGLAHIAERLVNYSAYLREQLGLPIYIPYLGFATSRWDDRNANGVIDDHEIVELGWEEEIGRALADIRTAYPDLYDAGVFGLSLMMLFDDPVHDLGGYQYFQDNEYALGLIETDAPNGVPGTPLGGRLRHKRHEGRPYLDILFAEDDR